MLDMLRQTGRPEMVVGWYHSHPGFGCWLSGVDINTQQSFEALSERAVAVVVDPIQSVKGRGASIEVFPTDSDPIRSCLNPLFSTPFQRIFHENTRLGKRLISALIPIRKLKSVHPLL